MKLENGTTFHYYKIISQIGAGGMGAVFLAEDTKLERQVALKILLSEIAEDEDRVRRFVQEAKAASALNHPNILTVYEIGSLENSHYIATELIKGETLREILKKEPLTLREILDTTLQIAAALNAAHSAGIVHRDIKPENVMLRDDRLVKVLDFGLAKLSEKKPEILDSEEETRAQVKTLPGMVMGTVAYMSPEQARGKTVDARSDIWSLGVVLYEMLTRRTPFADETTNDTIAAILTKDPIPLAENTPAELQRIIRKSLQKKADERYQTIKDFLLDVKNLKRELEFAEELERSHLPHSTVSSNVSTGQISENATFVQTAAHSTQNRLPHTVSSAEYIAAKVSGNKGIFALVLVLILVLAGGAAYRFLWADSSSNARLPFEKVKISRLTKSGRVISVAISPDGKYFAHVLSDAGQQTLFVRQTSASNDIAVIPAAPVEYWGITFSKDSNDLFYVVREERSPGILYRIPALGGTPQKILEHIDSPITFSPDGKQMAFVRGDFPNKGESGLFIANSDGTGERTLASRKIPERFYPLYFTGPSWSPDGKSIAAAVAGYGSGLNCRVIKFDVADGKETELTKQDWGYIGRVEWLADESGLLINAREQSSSFRQIWYLSTKNGDVRQITNDFNDYRNLSLTADYSKIVSAKINRFSGVWIAPMSDLNQSRQIIPTNSEGTIGMSWTPNGKLVYYSDTFGSGDLWIMNADGKDQKQITSNAKNNTNASVSPDGHSIAFVSNRTGRNGIWIMEINGDNPKQLTEGIADDCPVFSADGKWIVYNSFYQSTAGLWKVSVDGGTPVHLAAGLYALPSISPDGKFIAAMYIENPTAPDQRANKIVIVPIEGGAPLKIFDIQNSATAGMMVGWSSDGKSLIYNQVNDNIGNLWSQPVNGGQPKQISDFKDSYIYSFALSPDGKQIALSRGNYSRDAIMLTDDK